MRPIILVPGTYAYGGLSADESGWWYPGSRFWHAAISRGLPLLGQRGDAFTWSTDLGGLGRRPWTAWKSGGEALRWYAMARTLTYCRRRGLPIPEVVEVDVIAHSHGGQVAAYAAIRTLPWFRIHTIVTAATPVRGDMQGVYRLARARVQRWVHVHSRGWMDLWQLFGALLDGRLGVHREMSEATQNIEIPGIGHSRLMEPDLWDAHDLWRFFS